MSKPKVSVAPMEFYSLKEYFDYLEMKRNKAERFSERELSRMKFEAINKVGQR